jgi:hypothetical protein
MKANWKIALMCIATLAFVACKDNKGGGGGGGEDPEEEYVKAISVTDNSLSDWDALDQNYVFSAVCPADASLLGLKSAKVYADKFYIFIQVEPNMEDITDLEWVPFHVYINTDNSDGTGGYGDEFTDANADILLEGAVFANDPCSYSPAVFKWWGEVGGSGWEWTDPSIEHSADDGWGAVIAEGNLQGTSSQFVNGKIEIEIMRELVPTPAGWNENEFGIGFDIQQAWSSVGILPIGSATEEDPNGHAHKLQVKIKK